MSIIWMIDLTLAPLIGYQFTYNATEFLKEPCDWFNEVDQPWWAIEYEKETIYTAFMCGSNLTAGLSSVLIYKVSADMLDQSARVDLDWPLTLYFGQLVLWWLHYPLVHYACSLPLGLLAITSSTVASAMVTFYYSQYNIVASSLMVPYVLLMWYHAVWDTYMIWKSFKEKRRRTN